MVCSALAAEFKPPRPAASIVDRLILTTPALQETTVSNYFNTLPLRVQLQELGKCRFMDSSEFADGVEP